MDDPYKILGVERTASADEIRKAYRTLAKRWHPDTNPDKPEAEARFKAVSAAYALLSDPDQRARFDRGEIDASGAERAPPPPPGAGGGWRDWADAPGGARYRSSAGGFGDYFDESDLEDFLSRAFGGAAGGRGGAPRGPRRGADVRASLQVSFLDAARGASREVTLPDGRAVRLSIPKGAETGTVLRLAGQGMPGTGEGAPAGDLLAVLEVQPHRFFRREGNDIVVDLPVTLKEAVLGARVEVPTVDGPVTLTVPPRSGEGTRLRLRGRGVNGGHQYVVLKPILPTEPEPELEEFLKRWASRDARDPRAGMLAP
ncbi:DnaJ C-terminal domain-containing protein [Craurococcus roseus]|uniref:DnaJ C-terminal domain-containing protein n=1 Tax=Craurococcus roseus TaxID=77585 RepID=A0ABN1F6X9_9PROT